MDDLEKGCRHVLEAIVARGGELTRTQLGVILKNRYRAPLVLEFVTELIRQGVVVQIETNTTGRGPLGLSYRIAK
jgi:hypothetical protein